MRFVWEVLREKGDRVTTVRPDSSVLEMLQLMAQLNIGAVVVMEGDQIVGVATERDYARNVDLRGRSSESTLVRDIMSPALLTVTPKTPVSDCMELMTEKRTRHLPVLAEGALAGIISIGDVVKTLMDEQATLISDLQEYIGPSRALPA